VLDERHEPYRLRRVTRSHRQTDLIALQRRDVAISVIRTESSRSDPPAPEDVLTVLGFFQHHLQALQPDVLLTYGGDPISQGMIDLAHRRGIPVVFLIHNFAYDGPQPFAKVDHALVASEFARRHYRERVGLDCHVLPYPVDWERV
jgi:hypothetical protein